MNVIFESERIIYVRPSFDLVPDYLEMVNDIDNVARFIGERSEPLTEQQEIDYIKDKMDNNATMFSMLEKGTNKFIGNIEFFNRVFEEAEWGIVITTSMQNKGYGTLLLEYAVRQCTGTPTLWILENNKGAERLYRRIGFRKTGRVHAVTDGLDEIEFTLTET